VLFSYWEDAVEYAAENGTMQDFEALLFQQHSIDSQLLCKCLERVLRREKIEDLEFFLDRFLHLLDIEATKKTLVSSTLYLSNPPALHNLVRCLGFKVVSEALSTSHNAVEAMQRGVAACNGKNKRRVERGVEEELNVGGAAVKRQAGGGAPFFA